MQDRLGSSTAAERLQNELLGAVNRVNYNQDSLNALAGWRASLPQLIAVMQPSGCRCNAAGMLGSVPQLTFVYLRFEAGVLLHW